MAISPLTATLPQAPFVDPGTGDIALVWRQFLLALWRRTGQGPGVDSTNPALTAALAAETLRRQDADTALGTAITNEQTRAQNAEAVLAENLADEARARATEDLHQSAQADEIIILGQQAVAAEAAARKAADALLVPIAQLCSMWAQCNFNFLPGSDPGHGQPWLLDGHLVVGQPPTPIGQENGIDQWMLEAGTTDQWLWG
jgi:hypothetical protein